MITCAAQIGTILGEVQEKIKSLFDQVNVGQQAVRTSNQVSGQVETMFRNISGNADSLKEQSGQVNLLIRDVAEMSSKIVDEVTSVSSITQETAASVEEVLASVEEQHRRIEDVVKSFEELSELSGSLNRIIQ